jgi:serine/threonine-protein kinase PknG
MIGPSARSGGTRRRNVSGQTASRRSHLGEGIVDVPVAPTVDPASVILTSPVVAEDRRFCADCGEPVGRPRAGEPGRLSGFCRKCRHPFDFSATLRPGEVVGGQYEVAGCLAHGGLGWIYLARDKHVNDRWVVLKGLLNAGDQAAMAVAVAEKRFLAEIQHPNIVEIYNFVTHDNAGYIVMEHVGGPSLKDILGGRREGHGAVQNSLPVDQAIAYILAALPAFSYLHSRRLVYCDFKPENVIQVGDQVKLIDLGAVHRIDDLEGDVYGTVGFQAPEIAEMGVSEASDVYTLGRALAVLTLDFRYTHRDFRHVLPEPSHHPALARFESFHRFLLKATAHHPDDRFQTVAEMGGQLLGVLHEVVALATGDPQPSPSAMFGPVSDDEVLAALAIDAADPAAAFLANVAGDSPRAVLDKIDDAILAGQVVDTVEVRLRRARELIEAGDHHGAKAELDKVEREDPWEWRATWLRGVGALATGELDAASQAFDRCWSEAPGELAPKLAAALAAERAGELAQAAALYEIVVTVDPAFVAAAKGLARCRAEAGDADGALSAYDRVPRTHRVYPSAQVDAVRTLIRFGRYSEAHSRLERKTTEIDQGRRAELDIDLFEAALTTLADGTSSPTTSEVEGAFGQRSVRLKLEDAYRRLAGLTSDPPERWRLIDRANQVRPRSLL